MTIHSGTKSSSRKRSHTNASSTSSSSFSPAAAISKHKISGTATNNNGKTKRSNGKKLSAFQQMARWLSISSSTLKAVTILGVAMMIGTRWNAWESGGTFFWTMSNNRDDARIGRFLQRVCPKHNNDNVDNNNNNNIGIYCHPSLIHKRRTQRAIRHIHPGERILEIPRRLQLWDLDALRDTTWIRPYLAGAKHVSTGNPVDSAAYLAVYLALLVVAKDHHHHHHHHMSLPRSHLVLQNNDADNHSNNNNQNNNNNDNNHQEDDEARTARKNNNHEEEEPLLQYLKECMPTFDELSQFHPILWNATELKELLPIHSASFAIAMAYRDMVSSEYHAFTEIAKQRTNENFQDFVSQQDYFTFRILVLSRSFGTGPLPLLRQSSNSLSSSSSSSSPSSSSSSSSSTPRDDSYADWSSISRDEMNYYLDEFGIDLSRGSYAMVPILDFYDHHARPNVEYAYSSDKRVFAIQATGQGIAAGQEVVDSYGKYTDAHLFAKFGFVSGDGSGYSQANLAVHHRVLDLDLKQQFSYLPFRKSQRLSDGLQNALDRQQQAVMQYLAFDDGYEECVLLVDDEDDSNDKNQAREHAAEAYELKRLKLQHLARIANHSKRWHLVLLPRAPESLPARASNIPITLNPPKITKRNTKFFHRKEYQLIAATCRLISLTHDDYEGNAVEVLRNNLHNNSFLVEPQLAPGKDNRESLAAALEFRTHFCLARLASEALQRFDTTIADMEDKVARLNRNAFQTKEWAAAHLALSEMQALEVLRGVSFTAAREYEDLRNQSPAFFIRDNPCPVVIASHDSN